MSARNGARAFKRFDIVLSVDRGYVLGTDEEEIDRLGRQHAVWRTIATAAWHRAGIGTGSRVLDVGAGPGFATRDLAEYVGPTGHVHAIERSERFASVLRSHLATAAVPNVTVETADLVTDGIAATDFDAAWCRWVACFVADPQRLVRSLGQALRPDGVVVFHEYVDYASWRVLPRMTTLEAFVTEVMASWRADGGEPDIARTLPALLHASGFSLMALKPLVYALRPTDPMWRWPSEFIRGGARRLRDLARVSDNWFTSIVRELDDVEADRNTIMITPTVLEIIARRR